jgi:pimeloyl-ACP methyl ester carboxylesterase
MARYVLVSGAWLGGWCWQPIARRLREEGHDAYPVTLTGLGERVHLASPEVDLDTHITDVVNLVEFEDLHDVVLLGHSYAAIVVTGAADRIPERISQVVYLDAGPFPSSLAFIETYPPEARTHVERQVKEQGDGWRLPMPPLGRTGAASQPGRARRRSAESGALPGRCAAVWHLHPAVAVGEYCPRRTAQGRDPLQFLASSGARDDRQRQPFISGVHRPQLALRRATHGALADVLQAR